MPKNALQISVFLFLALVLAACNLPSSSSDEEGADAILTAAAETVDANLTEAAALSPPTIPPSISNTSTPTLALPSPPTNIPPTATGTPICDLATFVKCSSDEGEKAARALAGRIRDLSKEIGNPTSLAAAVIDRTAFEAQLDKMVDDAFNDTQMVTAARAPSYEELQQLFLYAYEGKPIDF